MENAIWITLTMVPIALAAATMWKWRKQSGAPRRKVMLEMSGVICGMVFIAMLALPVGSTYQHIGTFLGPVAALLLLLGRR